MCVDVLPAAVGDERLAARISLMVGDEAVSQGLVRAVWTDDEALSTRINAQVAHYTGQAELAQAIQEGLQARKDGDIDTATVKLGRAVQLATQSGNDGTVKLLRKVVEVEDADTGTVRVRRDVDALDEMELDTRSTRTVRVQKSGPAPQVPDQRRKEPTVMSTTTPCATCGSESATSDYCDMCGAAMIPPAAAAAAARSADSTGPAAAVTPAATVDAAPRADRRPHLLLLRRPPGRRRRVLRGVRARLRQRPDAGAAGPDAVPPAAAAPAAAAIRRSRPGTGARGRRHDRDARGPVAGGRPSWAPTGPSSTATSPPAW